MKKKILTFTIAAAIIVPTGAFALSSSYFANKDVNINGLVDNGVQRAVSQGLTSAID
jgi:hypothetical protein